MRRIFIAGLALALFCVTLFTERLSADEGVVELKKIERILIDEKPNDAESSMAGVLQKKLEVLYEIKLEIVKGKPEGENPAILIGRRMALASGIIAEDELEAVKYDGFVIKGAGNRIALAGYAPQGTVSAAYAFLRHAGMKLYPWHSAGNAEIFTPVGNGILKPFTVSSKPFFGLRMMLGHHDRGCFGGSILQHGDFRFAHKHEYFKDKGWLGWDHSAPYLVPMGKYYDEHPEYYAMKRGKRLPKTTKNMRVTICMSNPDVHRISAERAIEWMDIQKERRFFAVTDGDSGECRCPECTAMDLVPGSYTDRFFKWVNYVAREVKKKHPDNLCLTFAYGNSTRPPVRERPESNVVVMYCPWYWNSRATSAVDFASPLNITAMKEFMAWSMLLPDQMGLYDYPGPWVYGQANRIKFLAKNGVRVFYGCGGGDERYHWVNSQLLWDPFLDTEKLESEFVEGFYGPAAGPMSAYFRLRQEALEKYCVHSRRFLREPAFFENARRFMEEAEGQIEKADLKTQTRILKGVLGGLHTILQNTHPQKGRLELRSDLATYKKDLERYVNLYERLVGNYERLKNGYLARTSRNAFEKVMSGLGLQPAAAERKDEVGDKDEEIFDRTIANLDDLLKKSGRLEESFPARPRSVSIRFDSPDEAEKWLSDGSQADLITPAEAAAIGTPDGAELRGVKVSASLSRLPVIPLPAMPGGNIKIHAGRFYAERVFGTPVDADGCPFLDFHIYVSRDVPITIYMNNVHSDFDLHAGEQIVRIDFRNYKNRHFTYKTWDKKIKRIGFDIWPQDNFPPYPEVQDTEIVFVSVTLTNRDPAPQALPHRGKVIWLSQFRPNIPHRDAIPREMGDLIQRQKYKHPGGDKGNRWIHERFRTFTEHRAVSPIYAILTGDRATPAEKTAAGDLQRYLERIFGVKLPINPPDLAAGVDTGNAIILGRKAGLAARRIQQKELEHVGPEGFVIHAYNGRIAVAGADDRGTAYGIGRYLEDHGVRFFAPGAERRPDLKEGFLHELYLLDWPYFEKRPVVGGWRLKTRVPVRWRKPAAGMDVEAAAKLAEAIKDVARGGKKEVPAELITEANASALSRYVAANLMWDPFADSARLIREFRER